VVWEPLIFVEYNKAFGLAKRQIYKQINLMELSNSLPRSSLLYHYLLAKVRCFTFNSLKMGVLITPLEHSSDIIKCRKWGKYPAKTWVLNKCEDNHNVSWGFKWCLKCLFMVKCLTFAKRWLLKNQLHHKFLKALEIMLSKIWWGVHFYKIVSEPKSKHLRFNSPKLGVPTPLKHSLKHRNCRKWGETPYQNMGFEWF
jgi:hypothetical protein